MKNLLSITAVVTVLALSGCNGSAPEPKKEIKHTKVCPIPSGHNLDRAIDQGIQTISTCNYKYDAVMDKLYTIAAEKKSLQNIEKLALVVESSIDSGAIPDNKSRKDFKKMFSKDFASIPTAHRSIIAECKNKEQIKTDMLSELELKRRGLVDIAGDTKTYASITKHYKNLMQSFEIICESQE